VRGEKWPLGRQIGGRAAIDISKSVEHAGIGWRVVVERLKIRWSIRGVMRISGTSNAGLAWMGSDVVVGFKVLAE